MPRDDRHEPDHHARRWADAAWARGWHAHAIEVLDHAIRLTPNGYKLYRKRGAFYLVCPDPKVRDEEQGFADLWEACEHSGWREDLVRWVTELLTDNGHPAEAKEIMWELSERIRKQSKKGGT
jgi:hypothetical protein